MTTETTHEAAEAEVRQLLESWVNAVRAKDLEAIVTHYQPDVVAFDAGARLQFEGLDAYRAHWQTCLEMCQGPMLFETDQVTVASRDDLAFRHYLCRCGSTDPDGREQTAWMRATHCLRRTGAGWRIAHEHFSAPFDLASFKALLDLEP